MPPPCSLCPYLGAVYILDKSSCLALQVLAILLGSQGRTSSFGTEISGGPWGAIAVKLQRSAEDENQQNTLHLDKIPIQSA